jgi:hypothetical protein
VRLCGGGLARGARDKLDLNLGVAREGDLMAPIEIAEVDGLAQSIEAEACGYALVIC